MSRSTWVHARVFPKLRLPAPPRLPPPKGRRNLLARAKWAIRSGRWKLVGVKRKVELFDLEMDVGESTDVARRHPDKVVELKQIYEHWLDQMAEPNNGAPKRWSPGTASISEFDRKLNRADRRKKRR